MPIFEYRCRACGERFERLFLSASSVALAVECPSCGAAEAEKLFSTFGVGSAESSRSLERSSAEPFCGRCGQNRPPCD